MPTIMTHGLVGVAAAAVVPRRRRPPLLWALAGAIAMLPDVDVIAMRLGVPSGSMWSHRGIAHSILAAFCTALLVGSATAPRLSARRTWLAAFLFAAMVSHPLLDTLTRGAPGPALLAPFSPHRYSAPWRPLLATPIGLQFFSRRGLQAFEGELRWIWGPTLALAGAAVLARSVVARRGR